MLQLVTVSAYPPKVVPTTRFAWLMGGMNLKEDWRCVKRECGGQSVTICGAQGAHLLRAGNLKLVQIQTRTVKV